MTERKMLPVAEQRDWNIIKSSYRNAYLSPSTIALLGERALSGTSVPLKNFLCSVTT